MLALQNPALPNGRPSFRPGPTASADIARRYLQKTYGHDVGAISHVVTSYASISGQFSTDGRGPKGHDSPRQSGAFNYSERDAIELARQLASRLPAEELPLLRTAFESFVPTDSSFGSDRAQGAARIAAARQAFIDAFRSELVIQPQWPG
jgi:hypothetical protein